MIYKENLLLFFGAITTLLFIAIKTNFNSSVTFIFGIFLVGFLMEKILLGNSLKISYLTLPSFFLLSYIALMSIPSIYWFLKLSFPTKNTYFLAIQSVLVTFPLGVGLANLFCQKPAIIIKNFLYSKLVKTPDDKKFLPLFIILFLSSFPVLLFYAFFVKHIQLIEIIKSYPTSINVMALRFAENTAPGIIQWLFELLRRFILPLCVLYVYFISRLYNKKWKIIFWIVFITTLFISSLTLDRAEPVALIIMMILVYLLARNQSIFRVFNTKLLMILLLAITVGAIISVFQYQSAFTLDRVVGNIKHMFLDRIILDPSNMASWSFQDFSGPSSFLHGRSIKILMPLVGGDYTPGYPASFVGDLWRNFGWLGVIIGTITMGFIFQFLQINFFKRKSIFILSLFVVLLINTVWLIFGNALGTISVSIFLLSIIFLIIRRLLYRRVSVGIYNYKEINNQKVVKL